MHVRSLCALCTPPQLLQGTLQMTCAIGCSAKSSRKVNVCLRPQTASTCTSSEQTIRPSSGSGPWMPHKDFLSQMGMAGRPLTTVPSHCLCQRIQLQWDFWNLQHASARSQHAKITTYVPASATTCLVPKPAPAWEVKTARTHANCLLIPLMRKMMMTMYSRAALYLSISLLQVINVRKTYSFEVS